MASGIYKSHTNHTDTDNRSQSCLKAIVRYPHNTGLCKEEWNLHTNELGMPVCSCWVFHITGHRVSSKLFRADCVCLLCGLCMCAHVWVYMGVWAMCAHAEADVFLYFPLHHSVKMKSFSVFFFFSYVDGLWAPESNHPVSAFYISYWHYRHVATTTPYMGIGDLNSAPHACKRKCSYPNIFVYNCQWCSHCFA